jgi:hypothetical protein
MEKEVLGASTNDVEADASGRLPRSAEKSSEVGSKQCPITGIM